MQPRWEMGTETVAGATWMRRRPSPSPAGDGSSVEVRAVCSTAVERVDRAEPVTESDTWDGLIPDLRSSRIIACSLADKS